MDGGLGNPYAYAPWGEKNIHKKPEMTRKEILNELNDEYKDHEYFEELIESTDFFFDLGKILCSQRYGRNIELAKEVFNIAVEEDLGGDTYVMLELIKNIASSKLLNDKQWAKEIYLKVQNDIEAYSDDLVVCAEIITKEEYLNDKKWGREIIQKTLDMADSADPLIFIADIVASSDGLNDKKWANEIYLAAKMKSNNILDYLKLGNLLLKKDGVDNVELAKESYILAAKDCESLGCINMVAEEVLANLNDVEFANIIKDMTPKKVKMTTVKFTVYGGVDDKTSEYLINIVEDDTYYELEVRSNGKVEDVFREIFGNETFMKDILYEKWNSILKPESDIMGERDSVLYINKLIYEGTTYSNDYELSPGWPLHIASRMVFGFKEGTVSSLDY